MIFSTNRYIVSQRGFTLIELIVAITILGIVLVSVFQIYSNIIVMSKRLELARGLQENTRNITETIASDVRNGGIAFVCYNSTTVTPLGCDGLQAPDYLGNGTDTLILKGSSKSCAESCFIQYYLAKETLATGEIACTPIDMAVPGTCYLTRRIVSTAGIPIGIPTRLSDPLTHISKLHFYLSGVDAQSFNSGVDTEGKVTMTFVLALAPRQGLDPDLAARLIIPIQTTITQKLYKSN